MALHLHDLITGTACGKKVISANKIARNKEEVNCKNCMLSDKFKRNEGFNRPKGQRGWI